MSAISPVRPTSRFGRVAAAALGGAILMTTAGCGTDDVADDSENGEPTVVEIEFADGDITPKGDRVEVGAGDPVDLVVTADAPGELHLHAENEETFAFEAGTETFEIQIDRPGMVVVESHDPDQVIVQLEVR